MNEFIPHLSIETLDNGNLRLENETVGDSYVVDLHPIHVRLLAERLGLIAIPSEPSADQPTLAEQARDIDRLKRNMLRVHQHALQLQYSFANDADWKHADLTFEMGLINGLVDLLDMAVDDFSDDFTSHDPAPYVPTMGVRATEDVSRDSSEEGRAGPTRQLSLVEEGAHR
jgi:hypothetical protein